MALNITNREAEELADRLANLTRESKTEAVTRALRDRLARVQRQRSRQRLVDDLDAIAVRCAKLPVLNPATSAEILGYGSDGLPK